MDLCRFAEGGFIEGTADGPVLIAVAVKVIAAQVLKPDAQALVAEGIDRWHIHAERGQAMGAGDELGIVAPSQGVNHEHHRRVGIVIPGESVEVTVGAAFEYGLHQARQVSQRGKLLACQDE